MSDEDLSQVLDNAGLDKPQKFGSWFDQNFDCEEREGKMLCNIEGETMKVTDTVKQQPFDEDQRSDMIRAVKENHQINKESGITYPEIDG